MADPVISNYRLVLNFLQNLPYQERKHFLIKSLCLQPQ